MLLLKDFDFCLETSLRKTFLYFFNSSNECLSNSIFPESKFNDNSQIALIRLLSALFIIAFLYLFSKFEPSIFKTSSF